MKVLGEEIHFKENLQFSLKKYLTWWIILLITMVFDVLTTNYFLLKYGIKAEANLVTRLLMLNFGALFGNVFGKLLQLLSVVFFVGLNRRLGNLFLLFVILLNCWAVVINSFSLN
jgi:hypothetical protein